MGETERGGSSSYFAYAAYAKLDKPRMAGAVPRLRETPRAGGLLAAIRFVDPRARGLLAAA